MWKWIEGYKVPYLATDKNIAQPQEVHSCGISLEPTKNTNLTSKIHIKQLESYLEQDMVKSNGVLSSY